MFIFSIEYDYYLSSSENICSLYSTFFLAVRQSGSLIQGYRSFIAFYNVLKQCEQACVAQHKLQEKPIPIPFYHLKNEGILYIKSLSERNVLHFSGTFLSLLVLLKSKV